MKTEQIERQVISKLLSWRNSPHRKPLILKGARQVGKTSAVLQFGKLYFRRVHIFNFMEERQLVKFFKESESLDPKNIISKLSIIKSTDIDIRNDLIFFDEIQESPEALLSLKFFCEKLSELAIIAAGSYLGIMKNESSFPVGKVEFLSMHPLVFLEFLQAAQPSLKKVIDEVETIFSQDHLPKIESIFHEKLSYWTKIYMAIGGMPEVVSLFLESLKSDPDNLLYALNVARKKQLEILEGQKADFVKHSGVINSAHIHSVYESMAIQLSLNHDETTKRFKFTGVLQNQKGLGRIQGPLSWLEAARIGIKIKIVHKSELPLLAYTKENEFKMFYGDVGLLEAALGVPPESCIDFTLVDYKGFIAENFVVMQLYAQNEGPIYSWEEGSAQIEFLYMKDGQVIPLEVKSSKKNRSSKSLSSYQMRYQPKYAIQISFQPLHYSKTKNVLYVPFYLMSKIFET